METDKVKEIFEKELKAVGAVTNGLRFVATVEGNLGAFNPREFKKDVAKVAEVDDVAVDEMTPFTHMVDDVAKDAVKVSVSILEDDVAEQDKIMQRLKDADTGLTATKAGKIVGTITREWIEGNDSTDSKKPYAGFDAISSLQEMQPSERAKDPKNPFKSSMNEVVDATDGNDAFSWLLTKTLGNMKDSANYAVNLKHHAGKLLKVNFDHFSREGHAAYVAGHYLAMKTANEAHNEYMETRVEDAGVKGLLRDALIFNGMADHFLTDMFAAGHARTPRFELFAQCGMTSGGFYSNAQHDEENQRGVIMKNKKDEVWLALGDSMLWNYGNRDNRKKAHQAAKASLKEVALCFQKGCPDLV